MRLGQLARKVSVRPSEIVEFLASKNITIEGGGNERISDEHVIMVYERFAPGFLEPESEPVQEFNVSEPVVPETIVDEAKSDTVAESTTFDNTTATPLQQEEDKGDLETAGNNDTLPDVIKAPKLELKGLTVLGKVELPSPKKKETPAEETAEKEVRPSETFSQTTPAKPRNSFKENRKSPERSRKNPVALKREREAREAEERKKEEAIRLKEQRTQYYYNRVKPSVPTKAARIIDEPLQHAAESPVRERPKTLWGRFLRWLTT
jgi:hypothetical protein